MNPHRPQEMLEDAPAQAVKYRTGWRGRAGARLRAAVRPTALGGLFCLALATVCLVLVLRHSAANPPEPPEITYADSWVATLGNGETMAEGKPNGIEAMWEFQNVGGLHNFDGPLVLVQGTWIVLHAFGPATDNDFLQRWDSDGPLAPLVHNNARLWGGNVQGGENTMGWQTMTIVGGQAFQLGCGRGDALWGWTDNSEAGGSTPGVDHLTDGAAKDAGTAMTKTIWGVGVQDLTPSPVPPQPVGGTASFGISKKPLDAPAWPAYPEGGWPLWGLCNGLGSGSWPGPGPQCGSASTSVGPLNSAGWWRISVGCGNTDLQVVQYDFRVVGVGMLDWFRNGAYQGEAGGGVVACGDTVLVRANPAPDPATAVQMHPSRTDEPAWPEGWPVWDGDGVSGSGSIASLAASEAGQYLVRAQCGTSSRTATFDVVAVARLQSDRGHGMCNVEGGWVATVAGWGVGLKAISTLAHSWPNGWPGGWPLWDNIGSGSSPDDATFTPSASDLGQKITVTAHCGTSSRSTDIRVTSATITCGDPGYPYLAVGLTTLTLDAHIFPADTPIEAEYYWWVEGDLVFVIGDDRPQTATTTSPEILVGARGPSSGIGQSIVHVRLKTQLDSAQNRVYPEALTGLTAVSMELKVTHDGVPDLWHKYVTPTPGTGSADNLFGTWPNEPFRVDANLLPSELANNLPFGFLKWSVDGYSIPFNTTYCTFTWSAPGTAAITVDTPVYGVSETVMVTRPDVGSLSRAGALAAVTLAYGLPQTGLICGYGEITNYEISQMTPPPTPNQYDVFHHAHWNALCASGILVIDFAAVTIITSNEYDNYVNHAAAFDCAMDLYNNRVGQSIQHSILGFPDESAIWQDIYDRFEFGDFWIWDGGSTRPLSQGILLKSDGMKIY